MSGTAEAAKQAGQAVKAEEVKVEVKAEDAKATKAEETKAEETKAGETKTDEKGDKSSTTDDLGLEVPAQPTF